MNRQSMMRRARVAVGLCLAVAMTGCQNVETIVHGRTFSSDGTLHVSSLQPTCGCVSLKNKSDKKIWLESLFYGVARGTHVLNSGEVTRVLFDWGGPANSDLYQIVAFETDPAGQPVRNLRPPLRIQDVVEEFAPMVDTPCSDKTCAFGPMAMNRVVEETESSEREASRRGVNFSSVIEASAPQDLCGCMLLSNFSDETVTIKATLHGVETGQMEVESGSTVPLAFDWAGPLDTDVYVIEGVDVHPANDPPGSGLTPAMRPRSALSIRLKNYVEIAGSLVNMECTDTYADFVNKRRATDVMEANIRCLWNPGGMPGLGMHVAHDRRTKLVQSRGAVLPGAVPAPEKRLPASQAK